MLTFVTVAMDICMLCAWVQVVCTRVNQPIFMHNFLSIISLIHPIISHELRVLAHSKCVQRLIEPYRVINLTSIDCGMVVKAREKHSCWSLLGKLVRLA